MRGSIAGLVVAVLAAISLIGAAPAGALEQGLAAMRRQDYPAALRILRPLAEHGNAQAQFQIGAMYENGAGVAQDPALAVDWYRKGAEQGDPACEAALAVMYQTGQGVPQDYAQALVWFGKAADQGVAVAQFNLGLMFEYGLGVPQDYLQAHKWFNLAASRYASAESERRDEAVSHRDAIAARMTSAQVAAAQQLASDWKPK